MGPEYEEKCDDETSQRPGSQAVFVRQRDCAEYRMALPLRHIMLRGPRIDAWKPGDPGLRGSGVGGPFVCGCRMRCDRRRFEYCTGSMGAGLDLCSEAETSAFYYMYLSIA